MLCLLYWPIFSFGELKAKEHDQKKLIDLAIGIETKLSPPLFSMELIEKDARFGQFPEPMRLVFGNSIRRLRDLLDEAAWTKANKKSRLSIDDVKVLCPVLQEAKKAERVTTTRAP